MATAQKNVAYLSQEELRQQFEKMITRDLIFDVGADAANLLLPGSSIALKVAKSMVDSHKVPEKR